MPSSEYDIISIGDATIDHFVLIHDAIVSDKIKPGMQEICLNFGDKLPVDKYISLVAGNAANNAVGSARLGLKTAYYVELGDDEPGHRIKDELIRQNVDPSFIRFSKEHETNTSFVLSFKGERTIFVYHVKRSYSLPEMPSSKWVYLTSTGHGYEQLWPQVIAYCKKSGAKLGYNPGTYQLRGDAALMATTLKATETVFINVEEAQGILGTTDRKLKTLLTGMRKLGPGIVVITDSTKGAYAYDGEEYWHISQFNDNKIETTGAGDAFATGFIGALHYELPINEALRWASLNANSVVQQIGPQPGLMTKQQIEQRLQTNPEYVAKPLTE